MKIVDGKVVAETPEEEAALKGLVDDQVSGLKAKNSELLGKLKELDPLKGINPEEYKTLKAQAEAAEAEKLKIAGNWEAREKMILEAQAKKDAERDAKIAALHKSLEENVLIASATQAIAAEKGVPALLMPHVRSRTKLDDNGQPVVIDESGNVRVAADGKPLTITALIAEMKSDVNTFGRAFEPSGANGAGSSGGNGSGTGQQNLTSLDKIRAGLEAMKK